MVHPVCKQHLKTCPKKLWEAMALDDSSGTWLDIRNSQPGTPPLQGCVLGVVQAQLLAQLAWRFDGLGASSR